MSSATFFMLRICRKFVRFNKDKDANNYNHARGRGKN